MPALNLDDTSRHYRFVEVLHASDLKRVRGAWPLVEGWLEAAESLSPRTPKALLEGDFVVRMEDGAIFREVSYKAEHSSVEATLHPWAQAAGRRWARFDGERFQTSDGLSLPLSVLSIEGAT